MKIILSCIFTIIGIILSIVLFNIDYCNFNIVLFALFIGVMILSVIIALILDKKRDKIIFTIVNVLTFIITITFIITSRSALNIGVCVPHCATAYGCNEEGKECKYIDKNGKEQHGLDCSESLKGK